MKSKHINLSLKNSKKTTMFLSAIFKQINWIAKFIFKQVNWIAQSGLS